MAIDYRSSCFFHPYYCNFLETQEVLLSYFLKRSLCCYKRYCLQLTELFSLQVVVDCPSSGHQQVFLCQKWLADDEGDQLIERDLYESEDMRLKRRPSMFSCLKFSLFKVYSFTVGSVSSCLFSLYRSILQFLMRDKDRTLYELISVTFQSTMSLKILSLSFCEQNPRIKYLV